MPGPPGQVENLIDGILGGCALPKAELLRAKPASAVDMVIEPLKNDALEKLTHGVEHAEGSETGWIVHRFARAL